MKRNISFLTHFHLAFFYLFSIGILSAQVCDVMITGTDEVCEGDAWMIAATGSGTGGDAFSYLWNGPNGFVSTSSSIGNLEAMLPDAGTYNVTLTNGVCTGSGSFDLLVNSLPTITAQPQDVEVCRGEDVVFSVTVMQPNVSYVWQVLTTSGWEDIAGANTSVLTLTAVTPAMNNQLYRVLVTIGHMTGPDCILVSETAALKVQIGLALACNDLVRISVDTDCDANDITAGMFLEGEGDFDPYLVHIYDAQGHAIDYADGHVLKEYLNQQLEYVITDVCTGLFCWGYVIFEDKIVPEIDCQCPVGGDIPAGVPLANPFAGELTTSDIVADFNGGTPCWPFPPTAEDHYVDLYNFTVDISGTYTLTMSQFGDGIAALYVSNFNPDDPCETNPLAQDDDSFGIASEPQLVAYLTAGVEYVLVSSGYDDTDLGTYQWTYAGPGNLVTLEAQYNEDCILTCYEYDLVRGGYEFTIPFDFLPPGVDDLVDQINDNCDNYNEDDVSWVDEFIDHGDCSRKYIRRTYSVTYNALDEDDPNDTRDTIFCTQEFIFDPISLKDTFVIREVSDIAVVEDLLVLPLKVVELPCNAGTSPQEIEAFYDDPDTEDRDTDEDNNDPDEGDIDLVIEDNEGVPYAYPHVYVVGKRGVDPQPVSDELCNIIVGYSDLAADACAPGCSGNRKILRNWILLDWCSGEALTYEQIIKAVDNQDPVIEVTDVTVSVDPWACSADVQLPHPEHLFDDCDGNPTYSIGYTSDAFSMSGNAADGFFVHELEVGTHIFEYVAEDCCGNKGKYFMNVTVVDATPPVAVAKEFIVLSLTNIGNPNGENGIGKIYATDVDNGSYDACTGVKLEIRRTEDACDEVGNATFNNDGDEFDDDDDTDDGAYVKFCCDDLLDAKVDSLSGVAYVEIEVQLRVWDDNGNYNETWAIVRVEDKAPPAVICPDPLVLGCDMDIDDLQMTGVPKVVNTCGEAIIDWANEDVRTDPRDKPASIAPYVGTAIPAYNQSCGYGAIRRQFRLDNNTICEQWFVIEPVDAFDPLSIIWPEDVVVECVDAEGGEPSWIESTCELVGVSMESDTFLFEDGACYKILKHWSIINWCLYDPSNPTAGGRYDYTQTLKVIDTQDPVIDAQDSLSFSVGMDCLSKGVTLTASATDNGACASNWIKWELTIDYNADWTEDAYYSTFLPKLVNGEPNPFYIPSSGNGEEISVPIDVDMQSSKTYHRAVWKAHDGCNNSVQVIRYFQITDHKPPTPYCINLSTAVMSNGSVEVWAIDFNQGSFDNCTDSEYLLYTFSDMVPPQLLDPSLDPWYDADGEARESDYLAGDAQVWRSDLRSSGLIFDLNAIDSSENGFLQVPIYVWDECGNSDFCLVHLRVIDNGGGGSAMIAGHVVTEFGEEVEGVMTELSSNLPEYPKMQMTDQSGNYAFSDNPMTANYVVTAEKDGDDLNGVSTLDLVKIQRHILGMEEFQDPYQMIAADVNHDFRISSIDLIELRKLILGVYTEFPQNTSWRFIDASQQLDVDFPWAYSEQISIASLATNMMSEDFIGVKIGDVNGSVIAHADMMRIEERGAKSLELLFEDKYVETGEFVEIVFRGTARELYGYQFTLNTPGLELVEVVNSGQLDVSHDNFAGHKGAITASWHSDHGVDIDGPFFSLVFKALQGQRLSESLDMNSGITRTEAYRGADHEVVDIHLQGVSAQGFELMQNVPNPFDDATKISFALPKQGFVELSIFDVTGKPIKVISGLFDQGMNTIKLKRSDLGASGILYYTLTSGEETDTKHMLLIE